MCRSKAGFEPRCCCTRRAKPARPDAARSRADLRAARAPWEHDCRHRVLCADRHGAEVGGEKKRSVDVDAECETFVDSAVCGIRDLRIVDGEDRVVSGSKTRGPG